MVLLQVKRMNGHSAKHRIASETAKNPGISRKTGVGLPSTRGTERSLFAARLPGDPELPFLRVEPNELDFRNSKYIAGRAYQKVFELVNYSEGWGEYDLQNLAATYKFTVLGSVKGFIPPLSAIAFPVFGLRTRRTRPRSADPFGSTTT
jgi:hypothetical protein